MNLHFSLLLIQIQILLYVLTWICPKSEPKNKVYLWIFYLQMHSSVWSKERGDGIREEGKVNAIIC